MRPVLGIAAPAGASPCCWTDGVGAEIKQARVPPSRFAARGEGLGAWGSGLGPHAAGLRACAVGRRLAPADTAALAHRQTHRKRSAVSLLGLSSPPPTERPGRQTRSRRQH